MIKVHPGRVYQQSPGNFKNGPVIYWMSRDQRVNDNWALLFAAEKAKEQKKKLIVVFTLADQFLEATLRQYDFMLKGLIQVEQSLKKLNIPFKMLTGDPPDSLCNFIKEVKASLLVTDFDPLKIKRKWKDQIASCIEIPFFEVDAHNIVPCRIASSKQEFGAYTIRPKIKKLIHEYLTDFPALPVLPKENFTEPGNDWKKIYGTLKIDESIVPVDWLLPGEKEAGKVFRHFLQDKLVHYNTKRNDPNAGATSDLSPYLHFGQISAQRIAIDITSKFTSDENTEAFLEELIVRRELSDNFCFYNTSYNSFEGFPDWAKKTLNEHRKDEREFLYSSEEFELAKTHDPLWNAAQAEMVNTGKMHGYMRMYWAKKILEWTKSPEEALKTAIYLNDKYELDGRDPNGYAGCAWSIGGVHDRAWGERPVFGKIRFMNAKGAGRKFDTDAYLKKHLY
jgi:deoxyribodipyrimidine photo-lyase